MARKHFLLFLALTLLFLPAAHAQDNIALTIGTSPVSFTEASIYIINAEKEYESVSQYYEDYLGVDYWSLTYANGMTVSQIIKADVFDQILSMNVFYLSALENGMRLTADEIAACRTDADNAYKALSVNDAKKIDPDDLAHVFQKQLLAGRMYSVLLEAAEIDYDAVYASVDPRKYVSYDVEYLFRSWDDFDENGKAVQIADEKLSQIKAALHEAKNHPSLGDVPALYPDLDLLCGTTTLISGDSTVDKTLLARAQALEISETSEIIKTDLGLFVIRMIDNQSLSAYERAVDEAIFEARETAFSAEKEALINSFEYEINVSFWNTLAPGAGE
ncbi:MAG: hypothetical protein IIX93_13930 [Clostridia bacterium]|nr:hypothetical protein [Clostridia bacterium]